MATLQADLYGGDKMGLYATDPDWDDVVPIPQIEPEGALAAIAYPEDYAEAMSYLRAVMSADEYSPRCLKLTEHVISMNPAHYTVWLYRFEIVRALGVPVPDELTWLNGVSLEHLKNYQIWHHRQQLIDHYYPTLRDDATAVAALGASERRFLTRMLDEDTKNYHVWTYRQYLVRKLGLWDDAELASVEAMLDTDVRNNSAWSHRFFLVFANPAHSTTTTTTTTTTSASSSESRPALAATEHDPRVPLAVVDREAAYARAKIALAPQNQSPWNYLRGALAKGGRPLAGERAFAESFVDNLGSGSIEKKKNGDGEQEQEEQEEQQHEEEVVRSSHALDLLADACAGAGELDRADLCLSRLGDRWDRVRKGYWEYRRRMLRAAGGSGGGDSARD
ncbi:farnesyltransferase, partial [Xylariaceae sp. FL0804]